MLLLHAAALSVPALYACVDKSNRDYDDAYNAYNANE